jgi:hypothetical protein
MSNLGDIVQGSVTAPSLTGVENLGGAPAKNSKKEIEALDLEAKQLEVASKKLEILEKQANLQDLQERLAERELKRENKRQRSLTNGQTLKQLATNDAAAQKRCNHRKGGNGAHGVVGGQGDDSQYAVLKHTFANGDMWVRCLRCGKTWKPPIQESFKTEAEFLAAVVVYETAVNFQTRNVASGSCQFRFSDGGKYYREVTANSTLR